MNTDKDKEYILRCFELARKGLGKVEPNPMVGCVIVKGDKILSEGYHEYFGGAHAEANAINNAGETLEGSTLYCNLEPCCHTNKKTPPCVPLIINNKIKKVVISSVDPNPQVYGKGIEQLREAGIEVIVGILDDESKKLNKNYFESFNNV
ncbi:bifunctional diaminohydroxyphosphoribosylaminopyrimidine deaminase/5-amino-6-(5-phosphoribosylamino)uracil reductase RibD [Melioribacter sp. Ez-97]|uniref:bifunctional diaminohydroxyphosphoribosylaminopyrimidine deaminase/5-amino-6-(5-phosphoribosylamino)uracil reductase RibD n=1 Tax=Melioribacter sp. Ez-97 TaxID=3423434 RepID=UPI003EDAF6A2